MRYYMWDNDRLRDWEVLREEFDVDYFEKKFCENSAEFGEIGWKICNKKLAALKSG